MCVVAWCCWLLVVRCVLGVLCLALTVVCCLSWSVRSVLRVAVRARCAMTLLAFGVA